MKTVRCFFLDNLKEDLESRHQLDCRVRSGIFKTRMSLGYCANDNDTELYIVHKVQIKISSLRWSEKKVQIKVHAWTWTWAVILSSHKLTVLNVHQWSDVSLRSKLKFKFRHELWSELFLKLMQRPDLICELKIRSDLLYNSALITQTACIGEKSSRLN